MRTTMLLSPNDLEEIKLDALFEHAQEDASWYEDEDADSE